MDTPFYIVEIALNRPIYALFDYKVITEHLSLDSLVGCRVFVNFANSKEIGVIVSTKNQSSFSFDKLKTATIIDSTPLLSKEILEVLTIASKYYHYPLGQCINVALPAIFRQNEKAQYSQIEYYEKTELLDTYNTKRIKNPEKLKLIDLLKNNKITKQELLNRGFSSIHIKDLLKLNLISLKQKNPELIKFFNTNLEVQKELPPTLNVEQQYAVNTIQNAQGFHVFLLNGITGSGKTEVYLQLIANTLKKGKQALVLVPEISLTPQTFERFYRRFNVKVVSMHSGLSNRERADAYLDMKYGIAGILIGTRSSVFTPCDNLGLIVIDEEHDSSFKQQDTFRYHARSIAILRAQKTNCPIVLGSATPSLETIYNVTIGKYKRIDLTIRAGKANPPSFEIVDLKKEKTSQGIECGIGETLEKAIGAETIKHNQILLFLNRRGFSHHMFCPNCSYVFTCKQCDNPLTVHHSTNSLSCHICGNNYQIPRVCPNCGNTSLFENGYGTEQIEKFLKNRYFDIGINRIDRDTIKTKADLDKILLEVKNGKVQILIGTQMLAKGHDFPNVTLVGIIDIDSGLFSDDFRSLEYTAQLITQVAGRSGRSEKPGHVIIQTNENQNRLLNDLINPNIKYWQIATQLLQIRKDLSLPPFTYQAYLLANATKRELPFEFLVSLRNVLCSSFMNKNIYISYVLADKIEKKHNRFHFHILITATTRKDLSFILDKAIIYSSEILKNNSTRFAIEVDPIFMY